MCNDIVMQVLNTYIDQTDCISGFGSLAEHEFEDFSISRWVAGELVNLIFEHPLADAVDLIDEFALKMVSFRANAEGRRSERIFALAAECAFEWEEIFSGGNNEHQANDYLSLPAAR